MMAQKQGRPFRYKLSCAVTTGSLSAGSNSFTSWDNEGFLRLTHIVPNRIGILPVSSAKRGNIPPLFHSQIIFPIDSFREYRHLKF